MTKSKISILLYILIFLYTCTERNMKTIGQAQNELPDSTVLRFLKWYHLNEDSLHKIPIIKGGLKDTTTFYRIDFQKTEMYLSELNKTNCISQKYISDFRNFFIKSDKYFKENPQNDGPANGFEGDIIMLAQDYMDVWENLDSMRSIYRNIKGDKATIKVGFGKFYKPTYNLTKINNHWLIDSIYNVYTEN